MTEERNLSHLLVESMPVMVPSPALLGALQAGQSPASDLSYLNFSGVTLSQAQLSHARLIGAQFVAAKLPFADFRQADLRGSSFVSADLQGANLQNACLYRADLRGANLAGAILAGATLKGARYDAQTIFPEGFAYKSSGAVGPHAHLPGAYLNTANLRSADLSHANFLGAYLSGADLTGADLHNARLSGADLRRAFLTGAYLVNARLTGADVSGVDFRGANLSYTDMEHLQSIAGADFGQVQGLAETVRSQLLSRPAAELDVWNSYTRRSTRDSLTLGASSH